MVEVAASCSNKKFGSRLSLEGDEEEEEEAKEDEEDEEEDEDDEEEDEDDEEDEEEERCTKTLFALSIKTILCSWLGVQLGVDGRVGEVVSEWVE